MNIRTAVVLGGIVIRETVCLAAGGDRASERLLGFNADPELAWALPAPELKLPPPPKGWDLSRPRALRPHAPVLIRNEGDLVAEARPGGLIARGAGTAADPYVIENWHFSGAYTSAQPWVVGQLVIQNCRRPMVIRNCFFEGASPTPYRPGGGAGLSIHDSANIAVTHCRATRSHGFLAGACTNMLFEYCRAYSCGYGIFTSAGHHNRAYRCYVNDTTEIGVFLYNGPDNVIEECYVHDTGREGIGTNGDCRRHAYRNNVVYNCGWNGINMEGNGLDHVIEGNLVANTHYGILSMGGNGVVRNNRTFMCTQNGLLLLNASGDTVESNLVVESHQDGIWVYNGCSDVTIRGNTIIGAGIGVKLESAGSAGRCRVVGNTFSRFLSGVSLGAAGGQEAVVEGNTFIGGRNGIVGGKGPGVRIAGNRLVHTLNGMSLGEPQDARIVSNRFRSVGMPLVLASGRGCVVEGNESTMSYYHGFYLTEPSGCTVRGNAILGSRTQGIRLDGGSSNVLSANRIVSAGGRGASDTGGIVLKKTTGAVLEANEIEDANVAIRFREGCRGVRLAGNRYRGGGLNVQIPAFEKPDNALDTEVSVEVIPDDKRAANELPPVPGRE